MTEGPAGRDGSPRPAAAALGPGRRMDRPRRLPRPHGCRASAGPDAEGPGPWLSRRSLYHDDSDSMIISGRGGQGRGVTCRRPRARRP